MSNAPHAHAVCARDAFSNSSERRPAGMSQLSSLEQLPAECLFRIFDLVSLSARTTRAFSLPYDVLDARVNRGEPLAPIPLLAHTSSYLSEFFLQNCAQRIRLHVSRDRDFSAMCTLLSDTLTRFPNAYAIELAGCGFSQSMAQRLIDQIHPRLLKTRELYLHTEGVTDATAVALLQGCINTTDGAEHRSGLRVLSFGRVSHRIGDDVLYALCNSSADERSFASVPCDVRWSGVSLCSVGETEEDHRASEREPFVATSHPVSTDDQSTNDEEHDTGDFVAHAQSLRQLNLRATFVSDSACHLWPRFTRLQSLGLRDCFRISDKTIRALRVHTSLETLDVTGLWKVSSEALQEALAAMPNLRCLRVTRCHQVTRGILDVLRSERMACLCVDGTSVVRTQADVVDALFRFPLLETLSATVTDFSYEVTVGDSSTQRLESRVTLDEDVQGATPLPVGQHLRHLCLQGSRLHDSLLDELPRLPRLETLRFEYSQRVGNASVKKIANQLPHLKSLSMRGTGIGNDSIELLVALLRNENIVLRHVNVWGCIRLDRGSENYKQLKALVFARQHERRVDEANEWAAVRDVNWFDPSQDF